MDTVENQEFQLDSNQKELLGSVCQFYGFKHFIMFAMTRKMLIKALDSMIGELEFKLLISSTRYHSVLVTDIDALRTLYAQIV